MEEDLVDENRQDEKSRRQYLDSKDSGRFYAFLRGPFVQHNYLVQCGEHLRMLNPEGNQSTRLWRIFPGGGSRVGDACAFVVWLLLVLSPFIAITLGCLCPNNINKITAVVVSIVMTLQLLIIYIIVRNNKLFGRLWYVSKVNLKQYLGWKNQVKDVTLETLSNIDLLSASKKKGIITKLAGMTHGKATVLLYTKSFRDYHVMDPIISLVVWSALELAALIVQLEMMQKVESH